MPRRLEFVVYAVLIFLAIGYSWRERPARPPTPPQQFDYRQPSPPKSVGAYRLLSSGTAFSIDPSGIWLTARHVVRECAAVTLDTGANNYRVERILSHPRSDASLLWTSTGAPALPIDLSPLPRGQNGFHLGFPQGRPGDVHSRMVRRTISQIGSDTHDRTNSMRLQTVIWSEVERAPPFGGSLGGLSGSPVIGPMGQVRGITIAESERRGRVVTVPPSIIADLLASANMSRPAAAGNAGMHRPITANSFHDSGERMRHTLTIAKVLCYGDQGARQRRRIRSPFRAF